MGDYYGVHRSDEYLEHIFNPFGHRGPKKNHKYIAKIGNRYFYSQAELAAYNAGKRVAGAIGNATGLAQRSKVGKMQKRYDAARKGPDSKHAARVGKALGAAKRAYDKTPLGRAARGADALRSLLGGAASRVANAAGSAATKVRKTVTDAAGRAAGAVKGAATGAAHRVAGAAGSFAKGVNAGSKGRSTGYNKNSVAARIGAAVGGAGRTIGKGAGKVASAVNTARTAVTGAATGAAKKAARTATAVRNAVVDNATAARIGLSNSAAGRFAKSAGKQIATTAGNVSNRVSTTVGNAANRITTPVRNAVEEQRIRAEYAKRRRERKNRGK